MAHYGGTVIEAPLQEKVLAGLFPKWMFCGPTTLDAGKGAPDRNPDSLTTGQD